ncbi:YfcE family phosphodiesterase [Bengtsoniella intestinalis]|uniref:metallophosphoesterase family protein n=1 Tax=Bengtsoniella intestinalis TaxID=3073143 RepID=UPI00391F1DE7
MNILVVSDSHGRTRGLLQAVEHIQPDHLIHLGDGFNDIQRVNAEFPLLTVTQVPGNCDFFADCPLEQTFTLGGVKLFACHGHTRGVKSNLQGAYYAAREAEAQVLLFGHTHYPIHDNLGDLLVVNPGSIGYDGRYAVLEIADGHVTCNLYD